jgi:hypothetical protein
MVANFWLIGRKDDARAMFERLLTLRNDVGLLAEEYDSDAKRMVGNFPQALSHIALIHAAFAMSGDWSPQHSDERAAAGTKRAHRSGANSAHAAKGATKGRRKRS